MRFKGDRVKLLRDSDGVPAGAMGTVIEDSVAPWIELDEAYEGLKYMPPQGKKNKLGHYICMGCGDVALCEQVSDEIPPPAGSGQKPAADVASDYSPVDAEVAAEMAQEAEPVNPCKCIDCGGTEPSHSADCTYMEAFAKSSSVQDTLAQRGSRYGDFTENAAISQHLKQVLQHDGHDVREGWRRLSLVQREALEMIVQKIARILNGDPNYKDNWHDIQGYARLAEDRCKSSD